MSLQLTFQVMGQPRQKGSTTAFVVPKKGVKAAIEKGAPVSGKDFTAVTTGANKYAKFYEADIRDEACKHMTGDLWTGPVVVEMFFVMPRPLVLKGRFEPFTKAPDIDKMQRCVLDALTHVVYADDRQVVGMGNVWKRYANPGESPHTTIRARQATTEDLLDIERRERELFVYAHESPDRRGFGLF